MRAVVIGELGGPRSARVAEVDPPASAHHRADGRRVLLDVRAVGLSFIDVLQSYGRYQYGAPAPYVSGSEVAGTVVEADPESGFAAGDRAAGIVFWGGLAERALIAPEYSIRLPEATSFDEGAAIYLNYSTAWYAYARSGVRPGDTVLLHGAAGGVGTAILDLAAEFGVRVIAVVSTAAKAELALARGAAHVLRSDGPWLDGVKELTLGHGVDVVLDPVAGDRLTDSLRALRIGGTLVVIGFAGGAIPEIRANRLLLRNLTVTGISMDTMDTEHPGTLLGVRGEIQRLVDAGRIHPFIGARFPFERAADALEVIERREALGKVIVEVA